ncbi:MAG TPA: hypothetical protein VK504_25040 [Vicinamibacterales bacterium]|nr:hypothetical protein [Vicinamibacterales bacterium]
MTFAESTEVPVERTKIEIEKLVVDKHKAEAYMTGHQTNPPRVVIQFKMRDRLIRFELPVPAPDGRRNEKQLAQATRTRWRALLLIIKAKLEAVENGVTTFEEEFLAHIVMPGDKTIGQYVIPQIGGAYSTGKLPRMLPEFAGGDE